METEPTSATLSLSPAWAASWGESWMRPCLSHAHSCAREPRRARFRASETFPFFGFIKHHFAECINCHHLNCMIFSGQEHEAGAASPRRRNRDAALRIERMLELAEKKCGFAPCRHSECSGLQLTSPNCPYTPLKILFFLKVSRGELKKIRKNFPEHRRRCNTGSPEPLFFFKKFFISSFTSCHSCATLPGYAHAIYVR